MSATNQFNDGRSFEASLKQICRIYAEQGRGTFEKVTPPCRIVGKRPFTKVIFLPSPWIDFAGCWTENGNRATMFEAKSTSSPTLPYNDKELKPTQVEAMRRWRQAGAATWLLWQYRDATRFFTLAMIEAGLSARKSLLFEDGHEIPVGMGFLFVDFLQTAKRFEAYL